MTDISMSTAFAVEARNIHKRFGANPVLKDVSMAIPQGTTRAFGRPQRRRKVHPRRCLDRLADPGIRHHRLPGRDCTACQNRRGVEEARRLRLSALHLVRRFRLPRTSSSMRSRAMVVGRLVSMRRAAQQVAENGSSASM